MIFKTHAQKIISLQEEDIKLRNHLIEIKQLSDGYNSEMEALHIRNAEILNEIIEEIGYPTIEKVGEEASEAAWLIIQHSIGKPNFMRRCLELLSLAVKEDKANPIHLAYLHDRIAILEGKPQLYGTQFDWDENGALSPNAYDDLKKVNLRRMNLGLATLEEQINRMRKQVTQEKQTPPEDYHKRLMEMEEWRKRVGWSK